MAEQLEITFPGGRGRLRDMDTVWRLPGRGEGADGGECRVDKW